jgi:hypothetical protein
LITGCFPRIGAVGSKRFVLELPRLPEKEGKIFAKTDFSHALTAQDGKSASESSSVDLFHRAIMMVIMNVGQVLLTWLTVSRGLPSEPDGLEMTGVHLGPIHI